MWCRSSGISWLPRDASPDGRGKKCQRHHQWRQTNTSSALHASAHSRRRRRTLPGTRRKWNARAVEPTSPSSVGFNLRPACQASHGLSSSNAKPAGCVGRHAPASERFDSGPLCHGPHSPWRYSECRTLPDVGAAAAYILISVLPNNAAAIGSHRNPFRLTLAGRNSMGYDGVLLAGSEVRDEGSAPHCCQQHARGRVQD